MSLAKANNCVSCGAKLLKRAYHCGRYDLETGKEIKHVEYECPNYSWLGHLPFFCAFYQHTRFILNEDGEWIGQ